MRLYNATVCPIKYSVTLAFKKSVPFPYLNRPTSTTYQNYLLRIIATVFIYLSNKMIKTNVQSNNNINTYGLSENKELTHASISKLSSDSGTYQNREEEGCPTLCFPHLF